MPPSSLERHKLGNVEIAARPNAHGGNFYEFADDREQHDIMADLYAAAEQFELLKSENDRMGAILQKLGWDPVEGLEGAEEHIGALQALARAAAEAVDEIRRLPVDIPRLFEVRCYGRELEIILSRVGGA